MILKSTTASCRLSMRRKLLILQALLLSCLAIVVDAAATPYKKFDRNTIRYSNRSPSQQQRQQYTASSRYQISQDDDDDDDDDFEKYVNDDDKLSEHLLWSVGRGGNRGGGNIRTTTTASSPPPQQRFAPVSLSTKHHQDDEDVVTPAKKTRGGEEEEDNDISYHNPNKRLLRVQCALHLSSSDSSSFPSTQKSTSISTCIDTGAQVTVLSYTAAKKAGLLHLLDRRYAGHATGVGSCKVLGRIPAGHVSILFLNGKVVKDGPAITVLDKAGPLIDGSTDSEEGGIELLLGLDVLEEWEAAICLKTNTLTVSGSGGNSDYGRRRSGGRMMMNQQQQRSKWGGVANGRGGGYNQVLQEDQVEEEAVIPFLNRGHHQVQPSHTQKSIPSSTSFNLKKEKFRQGEEVDDSSKMDNQRQPSALLVNPTWRNRRQDVAAQNKAAFHPRSSLQSAAADEYHEEEVDDDEYDEDLESDLDLLDLECPSSPTASTHIAACGDTSHMSVAAKGATFIKREQVSPDLYDVDEEDDDDFENDDAECRGYDLSGI